MNLRKLRSLSLVGAAAFAISMLSACGASGSGSGSSAPELIIGVPYPQTGSIADYGANYSDGVRLAVKETNDAGGIKIGDNKVKVKAVYCDTQADTAKAASCGRKLSSQDGAVGMVISTSIETFPIMSFNAAGKNKFVIISSSASNKLVNEKNPLVVRYWFNTYSYMPDSTKLLKKTTDSLGVGDTVAIMQSEDEFGKAWADTFEKGWKNAGGSITGLATYADNSTDFYPQLTSLIKANPSILAVPGACPQVSPLVKQARQLGFSGRFIFQVSCGPGEITATAGADAVKGSIFEGSQWDSNSDVIKTFQKDFKAEFNRDPVVICADGYGQAKWMIASAKKAGSTDDPEKIRAAMKDTLDQDWNLLGIKDLQKNGETTAPIHYRVFNGPGDIKDYYPAK